MKKKFLALVMTLSMVLSLVPMTALAAEGDKVDTVAAGSQAASEGANGDNQDSNSNADSVSTTTGGGDSSGTSDTNTNTNNKDEGKDSGSENTGGTTTGDSSTSGTGSTKGGDTGTTTPPESPNKVAKNIDTHAEYETLDAAIAEAGNGATIEVLADCTTAGLNLSKDLTIQGAGSLESKPTITFTEKGIALWGKALTFQDCNVVMTGIGSTPHDTEWGRMTISASKDASLTLDNTTMMMDGTGTASDVHAIYFGSNNKLTLENGSQLTIKNYPQDALEWDGGDGGYNVDIKDSTYISDHNRSGFTGTFYATIEHSTVNVINSTGNGSNGSHFDIKNRSNVKFDDNGSHGLSAVNLTIDNSTVTANGNGANGIHTTGTLNICNKSNVEIKDNKCSISSKWTIPGAFYMGGTESKIEDSTLVIQDNLGSGIYQKNTKGTLTIADNATVSIMKNKADKLGFGGGIYVNGTANISKNVELYNNHAQNAGDDIYNTGTITFGDVGEGWVLDDCNHAITGWYDDGENARWCADTLPRHLKEYAPESGETHQLALKAAHGVDPVPLPEPKLETPEIDKTATPLNQDKSTVTLTVGGSEEKANIAVMFLLDKSTSQTKARQNAAEMLWNLKEKTNTNIIYDVVIFSGTATSTGWRNIADDGTVHDSIANFANIGTTSGTNMTAGIDQAKKDMKTLSESYPEYKDSTFLVTISDGVSYYWDENGVTKCVPIAAWNGNETVFETTPRSDVSTWEMMYSDGTSLEDVYGGVSQFLAIIPDKMQATRDKNYVRDYKGNSTDLGDPLTTYIYNPTKKQTVADTYASAAEFSMYYSIQGYADLVKSFARVYTLPMPEVNTDGSEKETWTKDYPWGREVMLYLQDYSTNAGAGIFHDANSEEIFQEIKDEILYSIQSGVVTDIIGENFDLTDRNKLTENTFTLKVGGVTLDATVDASNDKVVYFGTADENGMYPYEVKYQPASTDKEEQLIWTINKPVERSKRLTLSYSLDLINKKTASGTYTEPTNENAVLDYVMTTNEEGQLIFPVPTVSYTVSGGGGGGGGGGSITIPDDVPTGLDLKNHYGYIIGYPVDYYTGKPTTDQTKKPVRPEGKITRAEVATIYFRMLTDENRAANWNQVSGFSDVKSSAWYNNAISTLTKAGILKGYEDGTFQPNGYITRAEFATIAIRFFSGVYEGEDLFPDIKGHWAEDYINNAANKGLVKGYEDGTFGPDRYITRAEAVTLVNRTLNRHPHNDGLHQDMLRWPDNMDTSKWYYADMQEATNSHEPDKNKSTADKEYWGKMLPIRDWEALEKEWSNANSAPGEGEVV